MKKAICLLLVTTLLFTCVACQPTPEEEYVVHRDAEAIEEKLQEGNPVSLGETPEPEMAASYQEKVEAYKASLPEHWSETFGDFIVDADIIVDNTDSFPVYTISRAQFDMKQLEGIANNFFKDVTGIREGYQALKSEYGDAIASLNKRGMADYAQALYSEMIGAPGGSYKDVDRITLLEKKNQQYVIRLADGTFGSINFFQGYGADYMYFAKGSVDAIVHWKETVEDDGSYIGEGPVEVNPSITAEQGEAMVTAFMKENGLEGFTVASVNAARNFDILYRQEISQGWEFVLIRTHGYYATDTSNGYEGYGWINFEDDTAYSQPWKMETIVIYVCENGVEYFGWNYPKEVTGISAESVELLDFEQIQKNLKKLLPVCVNFDAGKWTGKITKMVLTVSAQQVKDERDTAYLMPCWVVFIDWYQGKDTQRTSYNMFGINAVDGSRMVTHGAW